MNLYGRTGQYPRWSQLQRTISPQPLPISSNLHLHTSAVIYTISWCTDTYTVQDVPDVSGGGEMQNDPERNDGRSRVWPT
ncbi:hypothetical protein M378DRAFT_28121 [Amanita muscaria Koide BX008]|uniref:Uncharacterized protein n=1 Tax=Amanita muscaria (strain Koide BX008) TaxID=946122 RepID=A0A0C2S357_AMAMK|nr:hypothetical protein M378DRAFT_28121 [Amanita muscaria Koide BX008]